MKEKFNFIPPIFIPKLIQNEGGFVDDKKVSCIIMDASIVATYPKAVEKIKKNVDYFIIDPVTNFFIENQYKDKPAFRKLLSAPENPYKVEDLMANEGLRREQMVWLNIKNQIDNNASIIMLPYIYSDSTDDSRFGINLSMVSDGIKVAKREKVSLPLYAMINLGANILSDYSRLDYLVERYLSDFKDDLSGYVLMFDSMDCKKADEELLLGLAYLTFNLSDGKNVIPIKIGDFGEILCAIGAAGYSSGLAQGETFSADGLFKKIFRMGRKHKEVKYVPELFNYLYDEELKKIGYTCECEKCAGSIPDGFNNAKAHFLSNKLKRMAELAAITGEKRIDFMILKLEEALKLATDLNLKFALSIKTDFLMRWKRILEKSKYWSHSDKKSSAINLDELIEEVRREAV